MAKPIRVGLVGCGSIGQIMHLPHLRQLDADFELVSICDISPGVLKHCGERHNIPPERRFTSIDAFLEKSGLEAVVVSDLLHSDPSIAALKAGCHVMVEKPMAHSLQECDAMLDAAAKSGKTLMVAYMKRYDPAYEFAQARVKQRNDAIHVSAHDFVGPNNSFIADIHDVRSFNDAPNAAETGKLIATRAEGAVGTLTAVKKETYLNLLYLCSHDLAILRGLFGSPKRIAGAIVARKGQVFNALLDYGDDLTGTFEYGFFDLKKFDEVLSVYCKGEVIKVKFPSPFIPYAQTVVELWEPEGPGRDERPDKPGLPAGIAGRGFKESIVMPSNDEAFRRELQHFAHCIRTGTKPRTTPEDGREDVRLCIEMTKAALG